MENVEVLNCEFASGQEPEDAEDFATLVRVTFLVEKEALARVLGKQLRVLGRYLSEASPRTILAAITNNEKLMKHVGAEAKKFVRNYLRYDLEEEVVPSMEVSPAEESDLPYTVTVDQKRLAAKVEVEFDVLGESA